MILSVDDVDYTINNPKYGYKVIINTALLLSELSPKSYAVWDNGVSNVSRVLKVDWLLNETQTGTLLDLFSDINKGRGVSCTFKLGNNSGFYPGGPDLGDSGNFGCRLLAINSGPVMEAPYKYFSTSTTFVIESNPSYTLPDEISEGDLQISTITGLRYPPSYPESNTDYGFSTQVTYDGTPYTIDKTNDSDSFSTMLSMVCNHSKASALIDDLLTNVRDSTLNIISQSNNYIFGQEGGSSGTYSCYWTQEVVDITHNRHDEFSFDLSFYKISQS